jgi:hypothetical protein
VLRLELGGELGVEVLRLAGRLRELFLRVADLHDLALRELEGLEDLVLGDLVGAGLDHRQRVLRAHDDQVERALLLDDRQRRVDDEVAVDPSDADGAHRAEEGQRRDHQRRDAPLMQRMSCAVTRSADSVVQTTCTSFL